MNAATKSAAILAAVSLLAATAPAQAGMGPCMAMTAPGAGAPVCQGQPAAQEPVQACPVPDDKAGRSCPAGAPMAGMMGDMAAGGMGIAMAVMGAIFGPPAK